MAFDLIPQVIAEVRPYTMVPDDGLATTIELTLNAIDAGIPGDLVECGTWMGGSSFAMLLAQRYAYGEIKRPVWMYDSFQGMSPPSPEDGYHARWWMERAQGMTQNGEADPDGTNFVTAPLDQVLLNMAALDLIDEARVIPGWLAETLPKNKPQQIAVLRVDCDWYDPCMTVYRELEPLCSIGAPIIIDDYDAWEGCRLATHAYLTLKALPWKIRSMPDSHGAWMIKDEPWVIEHATRVAA
jgi:hypothetical protein